MKQALAAVAALVLIFILLPAVPRSSYLLLKPTELATDGEMAFVSLRAAIQVDAWFTEEVQGVSKMIYGCDNGARFRYDRGPNSIRFKIKECDLPPGTYTYRACWSVEFGPVGWLYRMQPICRSTTFVVD